MNLATLFGLPKDSLTVIRTTTMLLFYTNKHNVISQPYSQAHIHVVAYSYEWGY